MNPIQSTTRIMFYSDLNRFRVAWGILLRVLFSVILRVLSSIMRTNPQRLIHITGRIWTSISKTAVCGRSGMERENLFAFSTNMRSLIRWSWLILYESEKIFRRIKVFVINIDLKIKITTIDLNILSKDINIYLCALGLINLDIMVRVKWRV